jgi:hypothetical protein
VYNALEPCDILACGTFGSPCNILMTLNKRADTAAAAIVHNMMTRSRPLVFLLVVPRRNGSSGVSVLATAMMAGLSERRQGGEKVRKRSMVAGKLMCRHGDDTRQRES